MANQYHSNPLYNGYAGRPGQPQNSSHDWHRFNSGTSPSVDKRGPLAWTKPEVFRGNSDLRGLNYYAPPVYMEKSDHLGNGGPPYDMNGGITFKTDGPGEGSTVGSERTGENSGSPSQGIARLFGKFADKCSVNGIPFIRSSKNPMVKLVWSVLLMAATGGMIFHLSSLIETFFSYSTHSQIDLTFSSLQFPAVTICNVNAMRISKRRNTSKELNDLIDAVDPGRMKRLVDGWSPRMSQDNSSGGVNAELRDDNFLDDMSLGIDNFTSRENVDDFYRENYGDTWEAESQKSSFYQAEESFKELFAAVDSQTRAYIGHQISDMLIQCSFAGGKCMQRNFTRVMSSAFGNCYTIQYNKFMSRRSGPADGMDLVLYIERGEYVPGITNGQGVQVVIHEQDTLAFPDEEGIAVASGAQTMIGLRQVEISRLGKPYGDCASTDEFIQNYGVKYTRNTCQKTCEQTMIRNTCKCYDEIRQEMNTMMKIPSDLPPCRNKNEMSCIARIELEFENNSSRCNCDNPCSEAKYEKTISSRQWPSASFAELLRDTICRENSSTCSYLMNRSSSDLQQEFVQLKIFYEDLNYEKLSQKADYEVDQFISDIGGILGLWIGLSVLSVFEIVHLLIDIILYLCCGKWRKKNNTGEK